VGLSIMKGFREPSKGNAWLSSIGILKMNGP